MWENNHSKADHYSGTVHHFDLEDERDQNKMREPLLTLENLEGLIIIDEIHHVPDLFKSLRVLVDQKKNRTFLVLGSASQELLKQTSGKSCWSYYLCRDGSISYK